MNQKEQTRLQILNSLLAEHMTVDQAAMLMGVSTRHTRRILAAYTEEGAAALAHGHRGRRAPNTTPDSIRAEVLGLARTTYSGVNHTHLSELLREREGIDIARNTLRRILVGAGLLSPRRRRPPKHRVRRQRMPREGMLIQIDGSYHRWLGEDGPQLMLLLAVDDATGKVAKDNTVRYRRSTLQLLPGMERPTYAGVKVDVLEGMDSQLVVEHEGQLIPSQEAPPRPDILRRVNGHSSHALPDRKSLGGRWVRVLASLDRERAEENDRDDSAARIRKKATSAPRKPTPKQIARWEAVHAAKRRGLSIRAITRETGIHRNTVR